MFIMDPREQRGIILAAMTKIVPQNGLWVVPSQTTPSKSYLVNLQLGTCTCEDFKEWSQKCKHMHAAEIVARREGLHTASLTRAQEVEFAERKTYRQNWPAYNLAQTTEKHRFQVLLRDLCKHLTTPTEKTGRRRTPMSDVVFAAAYKVYSTVSTRRFMCDLRDAVDRGHMSKRIHYNSISAYLEWDKLTPVLTDLIYQSCVPLRAVEVDFAVDSTGFSTSRFVRWFDEKYGVERSGHDWVKVHVMSGVKTNIVTAVEIKGRNANDAPLFRPLVETTKKSFKINEVSADKAYLSVKNIETVFDAGGTPFIPFKPNSTDGAGGLWEKMRHYYNFNRDDYLGHYHKRSNVESTFSMIKAKFRDHVRSRTDTSMKNEVLCKILCHNLCCVIQSHCELGIEPIFWPTPTAVTG
jgi:transposase